MDDRQLRYFAAIYEEGALSRAAERERVAVSALSRHLANLEADLGAALFEREPRGVRPTASGERLYEHARTILRALETAETDLRDSLRQVAGTVSIGMAHSAVKAIGVDLMRRVIEDHPKLKLILSESLSGSTLMHLMAAEVDLALVYNPPADPRLRTRAVLEESMVLVGRREIIGEPDAPIPFREIPGLPLIILRQGLSARALMDDAALQKRLEASARLQMNSVNAIAGSLIAGLGCTIGTRLFMREQLESGAVAARPIVEPEMRRTLYMCEMVDRPATVALETVRDLSVALARRAVAEGRWEATAVG